MAKRKRLTPALFDDAAAPDPFAGPAPEVKSAGLAIGLSAPPIAQVAGDAATAAALAEVAGALSAARAEGRLVLRLPLAAVVADHLVRDRIAADEEEMHLLMASLAAHGQRTPIDVTEIAPGRWGLISGWRRLTALGRLHAQTGEARFAEVLALVRRPGDAAAAYVAMVEENEVRAGLSYYERARIVAKSVEAGVFGTDRQALQALFAAASRPRRSKIGSFLAVYRALDGVLRFPATIPERLGLALAQLVETDPGRTGTLAAALTSRPARYPIDELALIQNAVDAAEEGAPEVPRAKPDGGPKAAAAPVPETPGITPEITPEITPGITLRVSGSALRPVFHLSGPAVDAAFGERLRIWLAGGAG